MLQRVSVGVSARAWDGTGAAFLEDSKKGGFSLDWVQVSDWVSSFLTKMQEEQKGARVITRTDTALLLFTSKGGGVTRELAAVISAQRWPAFALFRHGCPYVTGEPWQPPSKVFLDSYSLAHTPIHAPYSQGNSIHPKSVSMCQVTRKSVTPLSLHPILLFCRNPENGKRIKMQPGGLVSFLERVFTPEILFCHFL